MAARSWWSASATCSVATACRRGCAPLAIRSRGLKRSPKAHSMEPKMSLKTLIVERHAAVTLIRLNRPEALNALNAELLGELCGVLDQAEADDGVHCLV